MARATTSLPASLSPVISAVAFVAAILRTWVNSWRIGSLAKTAAEPINSWTSGTDGISVHPHCSKNPAQGPYVFSLNYHLKAP